MSAIGWVTLLVTFKLILLLVRQITMQQWLRYLQAQVASPRKMIVV